MADTDIQFADTDISVSAKYIRQPIYRSNPSAGRDKGSCQCQLTLGPSASDAQLIIYKFDNLLPSVILGRQLR